MKYNVCFLISHKYYKGYESYLKYYINNILDFYDRVLIIIIDNNSFYKNDIISNIKNNENIVFLDNETQCKFEIGAYKVGLKYIHDNNLNFNYYVFTQDTFILKNRYEFNNLPKNINASAIVSWKNDWSKFDVCELILKKINLFYDLQESRLCWCNSFIIKNNILFKFENFIKDIIITKRYESEASERYLGKILSELNNGLNYDIDGDIDHLPYFCHSINPYDNINTFFVKKAQQKNENTIDLNI